MNMPLKIKDIDDTQAPLLDHLIELRKRLVRCVLALAVAFGVCLYFAKPIFALLVRPLSNAFPDGDGRLIGIFVIMDTGGAIRGNKIDLWFDSCREALDWGIRSVVAEVLDIGRS